MLKPKTAVKIVNISVIINILFVIYICNHFFCGLGFHTKGQ